MKTTKKIVDKARKVAQLISELQSDVIKVENANVSDAYRGYILGTEIGIIDQFQDFAKAVEQTTPQTRL